jgi:hypothetical protein
MEVYKAIAAVMGELAQSGIAKSRKNVQQGYAFRGIDDVYNALAPLMAKHGLMMLPTVRSRGMTERATAKGGSLFYVVCEVDFDLVCAADGSSHRITVFGEAMDSADKATNKAMSAAYKYAALQTFCVPTEGDNDADASTHEVRPAVITDTQLSTLRDLCAAAGRAEAEIAKAMSVATLADLPAARFQSVAHRLEAIAKQEAA